MKSIITKSMLCGVLVVMGFSATSYAQLCPDFKYYPTSQKNGFNSSEFYKIIDLDAATLTDSKYPRTGAIDGMEDNVNFKTNTLLAPTGDGVISLPLFDYEGFNAVPSGHTYGVKYVRCVFAPDHYTSAYTKIDNGSVPSGYQSPCTINDNSVIRSGIFDKPGFVELSRQAAATGEVLNSKCGYIQLDDLYGVERVQWSFSSTSWKRGVICEVRYGGEGNEWFPQRIIPSETANYATFAEQGYEFEEIVGMEDDQETPMSIRIRTFDSDTLTWASEYELPVAQRSPEFYYARPTALQPVRIHQIRVFSSLMGSQIAEKIATGITGVTNEPFIIKKSGSEVVASEECTIELYTIDGKLMERARGTKMNVSAMDKGLYVVKAILPNGKMKNIKISI